MELSLIFHPFKWFLERRKRPSILCCIKVAGVILPPRIWRWPSKSRLLRLFEKAFKSLGVEVTALGAE